MFLREDDERVPACAPATKEKLAKNLSGLLRQAVRDARLVEKTPGYRFDMGVWHSPSAEGDGTCHVCMAGAVMAMTLKLSRTSSVHQEEMPEQKSMLAINSMRVGDFIGAATVLGLYDERDRATYHQAFEVVREGYGASRAAWGAYLEAARVLETAGL